MITLLAVLVVAVAARRGFRRGAPRELIDLLILAIGFPVAFRLGAPLGERLFSGWAPLAGRTIGALIVFGILSLLGAGVQRMIEAGDTEDRAIGAVIGGLRGFIAVVIIVAVVAAAPGSSALGRMGQRSAIVDQLGDPDGPAMQMFSAATGEDGMLALISFNRSFPDGPLVSNDSRQIPSFDAVDLTDERGAGTQILALVNRDRAAGGLADLQWSSALTDVAQAYAHEMYQDGFFGHVSARSGDVGDRLDAARIRFSLAGENLALAPNVDTVHRGLMNSPGHRANILHSDFTHIGIGAVEGPIGLIVVQVFFRG